MIRDITGQDVDLTGIDSPAAPLVAEVSGYEEDTPRNADESKFIIHDSSTETKNYQITEYGSEEGEIIYSLKIGDQQATFKTSNEVYPLILQDDLQDLSMIDNKIQITDAFGIPMTLEDTTLIEETENPFLVVEVEDASQSGEDLKNSCFESIKEFIKNGESPELVKEFLGVQGKLTLHRLGWASLNLSQSQDQARLEDKILELLKLKFEDRFDEVREQFENVNSDSRTFLSRSLPIIEDLYNNQMTQAVDAENKRPFLINGSDLKLLEIVAEYEEYKNDSYDRRQFESQNLAQGLLNFTSMVNSAYIHSKDRLSDDALKKRNQDLLKEVLPQLNEDLNILTFDIFKQNCGQDLFSECGNNEVYIDQYFQENIDDIQRVITSSILQNNDKTLMEELKFGKFWLRVSN